jgi:hypothetical protein
MLVEREFGAAMDVTVVEQTVPTLSVDVETLDV